MTQKDEELREDLFIDEDDVVLGEASEGDPPYDVDASTPAGASAPDALASEAAAGSDAAEVGAELSAELQAARDEVSALKDQLLRKSADLENARRRHLREKEEMSKFAAEAILKDMCPVLDDLVRALQHARTQSVDDALSQGVDMVARKFQQSLERRGVSVIASVGTPFDPQLHEAIQQVQDPTVPHNTIVQEFQRGYLLHERLLRPALVVVAQGGASRPATPARGEVAADEEGAQVAEARSEDVDD